MANRRGDAVEYFIPDHPGVVRNLRGRLEKAIRDESVDVLEGRCSDWAGYSRRIGKIEGLNQALIILASIEKETE